MLVARALLARRPLLALRAAPTAEARGIRIAPPVMLRVTPPAMLRVASPAVLRPMQPTLCRLLCTERQGASSAEELFENYAEARELLEDAEDGKGTVYFESDLEDAREAVAEVLEDYERLLTELPAAEAAEMKATAALKMEELRGRLDLIMEGLIHDED